MAWVCPACGEINEATDSWVCADCGQKKPGVPEMDGGGRAPAPAAAKKEASRSCSDCGGPSVAAVLHGADALVVEVEARTSPVDTWVCTACGRLELVARSPAELRG